MVRRTVIQDPLFRNQALKGEVTQWKQYASGHTYFSLRDNDGQMNAVIWKGKCIVDSSIKEGSEVVVLASLDLYAKRGNIQLVVDKIEPVSVLGELEKMKRELIEQLIERGSLIELVVRFPRFLNILPWSLVLVPPLYQICND